MYPIVGGSGTERLNAGCLAACMTDSLRYVF